MIERNLINLDDPEVYTKTDPDGMLNHLHNFPIMCQQAWELALNPEIPSDFAKANKIVILGMGGSAIGGDLVSSLAISQSRAPVIVCREYNLPAHVDEQTLVIASSYSGMTEETLSAFNQALETPAKKLAITTGGRLFQLCHEKNIPVFKFDYKCQPYSSLQLQPAGILQRLDSLTSTVRF
jgi:glucose/mannose-6-phosphate isomerase